MHRRSIIALGGTLAALVLASSTAGAASPGGTTVTVRVEGKSKTLLAPTVIHTHTGWITRYGAPKGKCKATSAAGALDVATRHKWTGTWESSFGDYEITAILGEKHPFSSHSYWELFVDNASSNFGACGTKLHHGATVLFAAVPDSGEFPLALSAPKSARVGHSITIKVDYYNAKGTATPLAGAKVDGKSTNSKGTVTITPARAGTLTLKATKAGYIRSAAVKVHVSH